MSKFVTFMWPSGGFAFETYNKDSLDRMNSDIVEHIITCINELLHISQDIPEPGTTLIENYEAYLLEKI